LDNDAAFAELKEQILEKTDSTVGDDAGLL